MDTHGFGRSDLGRKRTTNEDAFIVNVDAGLYAVCDGMGGHAAGEVASATAIASIQAVVHEDTDIFRQVERDPSEVDQLRNLGVAAVAQACRDVHQQATSTPGLAGMGCTATVLLVSGAKATIAHVGDSRLYLVRKGVAHQLTSDHTLAAELARQGTIDSADEKDHPQAHILTRAVGIQASVEIESLAIDLVAGDRMILCSDGLGDQIPSRPWLAEQAATDSVDQLPDNLIDFANACGGPDNITVVAVSVEADRGGQTASVPLVQHQLEVFAATPPFSDLTLAQSTRVLERCEDQSYEPGDTVWALGTTVEELLVVTHGELVVEDQSGRTALVGPGETLGVALIMRPRTIRACVKTMQPTTVLRLPRAELLELAQLRPWLGLAVYSRMLERLSSEIGRLTGDSMGRTAPMDLL